jgi:phospholipid N-methyltransferase
MPVEAFRDFAVRGGFENGCDIDLFYHHIADKNSVMELGAAYGRVIRYLLEKEYKGTIFAIERSKNFYNHLIKQFGDKAIIFNADMQNFIPPSKIDVILFLWSGISDFAQSEHLKLLAYLVSWLNHGGLLILDTILHTLFPKNVTTAQDQSYIAHSEYGGIARGYTPSKQEVTGYAKRLGLKVIQQIDYKTLTQRERILHILGLCD